MVWAPGDGAGLFVADTRIGRIGSLICGENTNPGALFFDGARRTNPYFAVALNLGRPGNHLVVEILTIR